MNGLIIGKKYVLSTPVDTVITDVKYNIPLGTVKAGQQYVFQAVSDAVTVADGCTIRPFEDSNGASVGVVGGSGDGGSGDKGSDYLNYTFAEDGTFAIDGKLMGLSYGRYMFGSETATTYGNYKNGEDVPTVWNNLTSFSVETPALTDCKCMFCGCINLKHWRGSFNSNGILNCDGLFGTNDKNCTQLDIESFVYLAEALPLSTLANPDGVGNGYQIGVGISKTIDRNNDPRFGLAMETAMNKGWMLNVIPSPLG